MLWRSQHCHPEPFDKAQHCHPERVEGLMLGFAQDMLVEG